MNKKNYKEAIKMILDCLMTVKSIVANSEDPFHPVTITISIQYYLLPQILCRTCNHYCNS